MCAKVETKKKETKEYEYCSPVLVAGLAYSLSLLLLSYLCEVRYVLQNLCVRSCC